MFGRGNLEDAKALQASFTRAKSPRQNKRNQNKGGDNGRPGDISVNHLQKHYQYNQGNSVQGRIQRGSDSTMDPQRYTRRYHSSQTTQRSMVPTPGHPNAFMFHNNRESQAFPSPAEGISTQQGPPSYQNTENYFQAARPSPLYFEQQRLPKPYESNNPSQPNNNGSDSFLLGDSDATAIHQQQTTAPWHRHSNSNQSKGSLLDEADEPISQPVMQFTTKEAPKDKDTVMSGVEANGKVKLGLDASRWNSKNPNHYPEKDPEQPRETAARINTPTEKNRGPPASPAGIVQSGISKGPGLANSRWA
ncbi:hypothetical protein F5Y11DRAFT_362093 [Daldinia sp. FL1419]|nr:hypothetical protein F5Y11DRAFT_362093 [Daldinia sp. FL1419]